MKNISDYIFADSWRGNALGITPGQDYAVLGDLRDRKKGDVVKFVGYDDVDNHYGIFVFTDATGNVLEVTGDFSGSSSLEHLKAVLTKQ